MVATRRGRVFGAIGLLTMLIALLFGPARVALAQGPGGVDPKQVPDELAPWIDWVREREAPTGDCRDVSGTVICVWPSQLELVLDADGGSFSLEVTAQGEDTVELPGDDDAWPQEVTVDGRPALVKQSDGAPYVDLDPGRHQVAGRFAWRSMPTEIALPDEVALIELLVDGTLITFPRRTAGALDLPEPTGGTPPQDDDDDDDGGGEDDDDDKEPEPDSETVEVSRLIADGVPLSITTRIDLRVSGQERELTLPYPLWDDAKLLRIDSSLPVSLEDDGSMKIDVRPGSYAITLIAQLPRAPESLAPPKGLDSDAAKPWPAEEVWVWHAMTGPEAQGLASMGQVALSGGTPVDRTRTHAPQGWPGGATYKVTTKTPLKFEVLQRGVSETAKSELSLSREAVLDLDANGWFLRDQIAGTLQGTTRLDLTAGPLDAALVDGVPQVITVGAQGQTGVEVRNPDLRLQAGWRADGRTIIPLAGWSESFDRVDLEFRLPRGWDILRASGPGRMSETWVDRWQNPLDIVLMLLCCVAVGLWVDWRVAGATLVGLVLLYTPTDDAFIALLVLIGAAAGLKKLMERELAPWLAWGARSAWMLCVGLLIAWVALFLPDGLHRVWTEGAPAFGDLRFERAFDTLFGFAFAAVLFAGFVSGVSWGIGRLRGFSPRVIVPAVVVVFVLVIGVALVNMGGGNLSPSKREDGAVAASAPPPPPVEEAPEVEEEMLAEPAAAEAPPGRYAMKSKEEAPEDDVWADLDGKDVGEAYGVGGLGLSGTGRGGGGTGEGTIGLGDASLLGKGVGQGQANERKKRDEAPAEPTSYVDDESLPDAPPPEIPQTGRATPDWTGRVWTVNVDRTVEPDESLSLTLISPAANKLIALLRVLALTALVVAMVRAGWPLLRRRPAKAADGKAASKVTAATTAVVVWLAVAASAQAAPPPELLDELAKRVNAEPQAAPSPDCGQACALVPRLTADVDPEGLTLDIEVHMAGPGVYALPGSIATWSPSRVLVNKKPAEALVARGGQILVHLPEGVHQLSVSGPIAGDSLSLSLSTAPKRVEVRRDGWTVRGVDDRDTATALAFVREGTAVAAGGDEPGPTSVPDPSAQSEQPTDDSKTSEDLPVWLAVDRYVEIGPRWTMRTTVRRLNDGPSPVTIRVPLIEGEKMIESSEKIDDPKATLTLDNVGEVVSWTSILETRDTLALTAPKDGEWTETWTLECGAAWQCDAEGIPPTRKSGAVSLYHPWPGEAVKVNLFKPTPAEGPRVSVDEARLELSVGDAGTSAELTAQVRTSTVGERTITLPPEAHLERVRVDGSEVPTAKDAHEVRLTFQPGLHDVRIEWKQDAGFASAYTTPEVSLGGEAMNLQVLVRFEDDHDPVILWTSGDGQGPVVWFWAWVAALAGFAAFMTWLARGRGGLGAQVRYHDWLLLGLGFDVVVLPAIYAWFLLVGQRRELTSRLSGDDTGDRRYNALQMVTVLLTALVVLISLETARQLLTGRVDTMVDNLFSGTTLRWYTDQSDGALPRAYVLSIHPGLWRVVWIAWLAWFGWRAYTWAKWSFAEVGEGGWLRWPPPPTMAEAPETVQQVEAAPAPAEALTGDDPAADSSQAAGGGEPDDDGSGDSGDGNN